MKTRTYLFTAIAVYLVSLIALTPASSVLYFIGKDQHNISISAVSGTLWNGSLESARINNHRLTDLYWSFSAWGLLTGELVYDVSANYLSNPITASFGTSLRDSLNIYNLSAAMDAFTIGNLANLPIGELSGEFIFKIDSGHWSSNKTPGMLGKILWNKAGIIVAEKADLGNIVINFNANPDKPLSATITNSSGDLDLNGDFTADTDGKYSLNAKLIAKPSASRNLLQSLKYFAKKTADRQYEINYSGKLAQLGFI